MGALQLLGWVMLVGMYVGVAAVFAKYAGKKAALFSFGGVILVYFWIKLALQLTTGKWQ